MKPFKFLHIADTHLGYYQYKKTERFIDMNRALKSTLNIAIENEVDFVIISGDLFHKSNLSPECMIAANRIFTAFKQDSKNMCGTPIPIIVIEGNHDKGHNQKMSWLKFLAENETIILLIPDFYENGTKMIFPDYDFTKKRGGKIQIGDAIIYGIPYYGSTTNHLFPLIYDAIEEEEGVFNILMMHFGHYQNIAKFYFLNN